MKYKAITLFTLWMLLLSACESLGGTSLNGTSWELSEIRGKAPLAGSHITIAFEDGQVKGSGGCNSYGGEYRVRGDTIKFGMMMSTLMACADTAMMEQETAFMQMLGQAQRVELVDDQLQIIGSEGEALVFIPH